MSGNAAERARVFVLHLALNDAAAEGAIVGCRRDAILQGGRGIEGRARHAQRAKDFALAKCVKRFVGQAFEDDAENDEADVAVFGARAGAAASGVVKAACRRSSRV